MKSRPWPLVATVMSCLSVQAAHATCPPQASWPTPDWPDDTAATAAAKGDAIKSLEDYLFTLKGADVDRKGIRTDAVVIIKDGRLIYEKYARGYDANRSHLAWSVSKSVTSALAGIAVGEGRIQVGESVCKYRSFKNTDICRVSVENVLTFGSGLNWAESYENDLPRASSVGAMLYGEGRRDMAEFVAGHPFRADPGTLCSYSSGDTVLLSSVVTAVMQPVHGVGFAHELLFNKVGMKNATLERDQKGTFTGASYFYAPARDMARFGYLYLNDGCWDGERILPEGWVQKSVTVSDVFKKARIGNEAVDRSGYSWWTNQAVPEAGLDKPFPDVPDDMYAARGHWGQSITVIPSKRLVVVRLGDDRETGITDFNLLLKHALEVAQ